MRSILFSIALLTAALSVVSLPAASTLPVIADATAEAGPDAWWVSAGAPEGRCLAAMVAASPSWIDPTTATPIAQVSRLLRRPDITPTNAVSLGGLYNADAVVTGALSRVGDHGVAWTGARRAAVEISVSTIDVSSGVSVEWSGRRVAFASTDDEALALACAQLGQAMASSSAPAGAGVVELPEQGQVVVRTRSGTAFPFIALVTSLREIHPAVIDVREVWATEGTISLALTLDEGTAWPDVASRIVALDGRTLTGVRVLSAIEEGDRAMLWIDAPPSER